jgi:DNA polymerase-2
VSTRKAEGFIVHSSFSRGRGSSRLYLIGRLESGETFAVVEDRQRPCLYVRSSDLSLAMSVLGGGTFSADETPLRTMDGEPCIRLSWDRVQQWQHAAEELLEGNVRTYEADIRFPDQYLISRAIHGSLSIEGPAQQGRRVDRVYINPILVPSGLKPSLSVLSLDIETDPHSSEIYAMGLACRSPWAEAERREVLFSGTVNVEGADEITAFPDEGSMLRAFCERIVEWDPDILTGWNVIEFDFMTIAKRMEMHDIPFQIGRSDTSAAFLPGEGGRSGTAIVPGRQVLDGVRLVRAGPQRFSEYTLESVASRILGRGKRLEQGEDESKLQALDRLRRENPINLCRYCLEDARLVLDILERTGLFDLTLTRCLLTGISLDRAWTSIPVFEHLYIENLHHRGMVAPSKGVDPLPTVEAQGGALLEPKPGLYENVLVFDFKSLYPTIIRTFNIDPLSFVQPHRVLSMPKDEQRDLIRAPNGARFRRDRAILPEILERFFESRDEARRRGDDVASHVYKIIMNSFYGVLGARGSRFASGYLAGAVTGFGHLLLDWCRDLLQGGGYRVLYGDTDSLFVQSARSEETRTPGTLVEEADSLCAHINDELGAFVRGEYGVESFLELEFEKAYYRFFLPPVRTPAASRGAEGRGRAKGYAGLLIPVGELVKIHDFPKRVEQIEVVGMEAVRRDWTDLARSFQIGLLHLLFTGVRLEQIRSFIGKTVRDLYDGKLDQGLVYRKALRKPVSRYTRSKPPHVRAAGMLPPEEQRGLIHYLWTRDGPQPLGPVSSTPDYDHYVEKQLRPIAQSFADVLETSVDSLFGQDEQLRLF